MQVLFSNCGKALLELFCMLGHYKLGQYFVGLLGRIPTVWVFYQKLCKHFDKAYVYMAILMSHLTD